MRVSPVTENSPPYCSSASGLQVALAWLLEPLRTPGRPASTVAAYGEGPLGRLELDDSVAALLGFVGCEDVGEAWARFAFTIGWQLSLCRPRPLRIGSAYIAVPLVRALEPLVSSFQWDSLCVHLPAVGALFALALARVGPEGHDCSDQLQCLAAVVEIALLSFFLLVRHVVIEELPSLLGVVIRSVVADCEESLKSLQCDILKVDVGFDLVDLVPCSFAFPRG